MEIVKTELKCLKADEGKVLRQKELQYDENGNEIERDTFKTIYLAINGSEDNYEEIDEVEVENNEYKQENY